MDGKTMSTKMDEAIKRWTAKRKSALVLVIIRGKTTLAEASRTYDLSPSEVESWVEDGKRGMESAFQLMGWQVRKQPVGFRPVYKPCHRLRLRQTNAGRPICAASGLAVMAGQPMPFLLRSDNGLVFTSRAYTALVRSYGLRQESSSRRTARSRTGWSSGLSARSRSNAYTGTASKTLQHASRAIADWSPFYNHRRPHQALKMKTPAEAFALAA
jgi:putative transposase